VDEELEELPLLGAGEVLEGVVEALDGLGDELEVEVLGLLRGELALGGRDGGA